jgi:hypothetical protein
LPLPMEHQLQYGAKLKGKWFDTPWNGDVEGELVRPEAKKKGPPPRPHRKWTCRIENLSPDEKSLLRATALPSPFACAFLGLLP